MKRRFNRGNIKDSCGSIIDNMNLDETLNYIDKIFESYLLYIPLSEKALNGKKILEIGSGDNLGVALRFLAAGASKVLCIDKFYPVRSHRREYELYKALKSQLNDISKKNFDKAIDLTNGIKINSAKLKCIYGVGIENAKHLLESEKFDLIVSNATLEHIYNLDATFSIMDKLLTPGGYMVHRIDLKPHTLFQGMHPLTFLTIPEYLYHLMTKNSGKPNRKLINYYRVKMRDLGYDTTILITKLIGKKKHLNPPGKKVYYNVDYFKHTLDLVREIRPKLNKTFKDMSDEDLIVKGIILIARNLKTLT